MNVRQTQRRRNFEGHKREGGGCQKFHRAALLQNDPARAAEARVLVAAQYQNVFARTHAARAAGTQEADRPRGGASAAAVEEENHDL